MKGHEILKFLETRRNEKHHFVKWWRIEDDFLDYDLIDRFIENFSGSTEIGGMDLLTIEDMWAELQRIAGNRVKLLHETSGNKVEWVHHGKSGTTTQVCLYCPETLMAIFDVESKGNPIGS